MIALVGGCGGGSSKPALATQDHLVALSNQLSAIHSQYLAAQRRLAKAQRAVARVRANTVTVTPSTSRVTVTRVSPLKPPARSSVLTIDNLCAPIRTHAANGPQRRAQQLRERRRRQALYYLNLSCPPEGA
jgi:hypothetical protein